MTCLDKTWRSVVISVRPVPLHCRYSQQSCRGPAWRSQQALLGITRHRKPKHPPLLLPIQRHFPLPATHRMQVEMPWLPTIQDRTDDVRCQSGHPKHLADPTHLEFEAARHESGNATLRAHSGERPVLHPPGIYCGSRFCA